MLISKDEGHMFNTMCMDIDIRTAIRAGRRLAVRIVYLCQRYPRVRNTYR